MPTGRDYPEYLTSESLDEQHRRVIDFVKKFRKEKEYGPTTHDIANGLGEGFGQVRKLVARLERSGYLMRPDKIYRALRVARDEEHIEKLHEVWLARVRALPVEEKKALLVAAEKLRDEMRASAGEGVGP